MAQDDHYIHLSLKEAEALEVRYRLPLLLLFEPLFALCLGEQCYSSNIL